MHCGHVEGDYEDNRRHRGKMETEAEMTAYMVNRSRGMSKDAVEAFSPVKSPAGLRVIRLSWRRYDPRDQAFQQDPGRRMADHLATNTQETSVTRKTFIDEIQDPVTGETHRIEAPTEAELDAATERYVTTLEGDPVPDEDADEVHQASSDPTDPPVDPQQPLNPA